ncbi:hypothetical protein IAD21_06284 [Abditibacteriota bacterium]|nr:hypothetical protein IAD21_06284 [Abditibacteriota bacterium]
MEADPIYKVSSNAVFEAFDDEVIVINMVSGSYFALDQVGLGIWTLLEGNHSLHHIVETTKQHYQGDPVTIEESVKVLVGELEQEGLIIRAEEGSSNGASVALLSSSPINGTNRPIFQKPVLSKFTDMQDLLLLDPIHEVDEMGWPHAKAAPSTEM